MRADTWFGFDSSRSIQHLDNHRLSHPNGLPLPLTQQISLPRTGCVSSWIQRREQSERSTCQDSQPYQKFCLRTGMRILDWTRVLLQEPPKLHISPLTLRPTIRQPPDTSRNEPLKKKLHSLPLHVRKQAGSSGRAEGSQPEPPYWYPSITSRPQVSQIHSLVGTATRPRSRKATDSKTKS